MSATPSLSWNGRRSRRGQIYYPIDRSTPLPHACRPSYHLVIPGLLLPVLMHWTAMIMYACDSFQFVAILPRRANPLVLQQFCRGLSRGRVNGKHSLNKINKHINFKKRLRCAVYQAFEARGLQVDIRTRFPGDKPALGKRHNISIGNRIYLDYRKSVTCDFLD